MKATWKPGQSLLAVLVLVSSALRGCITSFDTVAVLFFCPGKQNASWKHLGVTGRSTSLLRAELTAEGVYHMDTS